MKTLILNQDEVKELLTIKECVDAVRDAYVSFNSGQVIQPPIASIDVPNHHGEMDFKFGYAIKEDIIGIKMAGGFWDNPKNYNIPSGVAIIVLFDAKNGIPLCILDGTLITSYRTAAAGTLAATLLAKEDSKTVCVIGTGAQARMQIIALSQFFNIKKVKVWGINGIQEYVTYMRDICKNIEFIPCSNAEDAVKNSDIIITATASEKAIVMNEWIDEGTHINAMGCDSPSKQELDPEIFTRAKIINDNKIECMKRGDTQHAINKGLISCEDIYSEIGELLLGQREGRTNNKEITVFDSTGMSMQDIYTSLLVYNKAIKEKKGEFVSVI